MSTDWKNIPTRIYKRLTAALGWTTCNRTYSLNSCSNYLLDSGHWLLGRPQLFLSWNWNSSSRLKDCSKTVTILGILSTDWDTSPPGLQKANSSHGWTYCNRAYSWKSSNYLLDWGHGLEVLPQARRLQSDSHLVSLRHKMMSRFHTHFKMMHYYYQNLSLTV